MNDQRGTRQRWPLMATTSYPTPGRVNAAITAQPGLAMPDIQTSMSRRLCSIPPSWALVGPNGQLSRGLDGSSRLA